MEEVYDEEGELEGTIDENTIGTKFNLICEGVGKNGDGVFYLPSGKIVFVPEAIKGIKYRIRIEKVCTTINLGSIVHTFGGKK